MSNVNAEIKWQGNDNAWFTTNSSTVYPANIQIFHTDGRYKFTDGVTSLGALPFLGGAGTASWGSITGTLSSQTDLQTALNAKQNTIGYTTENVANKSTDVNTDQSSNTKYPSVKSVYDWVTGLFVKKGTLTTNTIPKATGGDTIGDSSITDDGSDVTVNGNFYASNDGFNNTELSISPTGIFNTHDVKVVLDAPDIYLPRLTASQIVEINASQNLISVAKGNAYNKNFGSTSSTVTEGNDSRLSDARAEKMYAYQNTDSTVTGSTSQTVLFNGKINAGDMGTNGRLTINAVPFKSGTAGTFTLTMYVSTVGTNTVGSTGVPTSSTQLGIVALTSTQLFGGNFNRSIANKNSASTNNSFPSSIAITNDNSASTSARTAININTANDFWVVITGQLSNAGDTGGLDNVQCQIDKP
jgi:hypothetical protein